MPMGSRAMGQDQTRAFVHMPSPFGGGPCGARPQSRRPRPPFRTTGRPAPAAPGRPPSRSACRDHSSVPSWVRPRTARSVPPLHRLSADKSQPTPRTIAPLATGEFRQRRRELGGVEIGPEHIQEDQLGIGALPEEEIRQALLSARADQQIRVGHHCRRQETTEGLPRRACRRPACRLCAACAMACAPRSRFRRARHKIAQR